MENNTEYKNLHEFLESPGKIGLVVEGGGMRSIFPTSILKTLSDHGYSNRFNMATGSSAGATHIFYMLGGNTQFPIDLNATLLTNAGFVDFKRLHRIMDINILEDYMYKEDEEHNTVEKMRKNKTKLLVPLTNAVTSEQEVFELSKAEDPIHLLNAGMSIPVLDNEVRYINGKGYIDGGLLDILPIHLIEKECDRILVIRSTRKTDYTTHKFMYGMFSKFVYHSSFAKGVKMTKTSLKNKKKAFKRLQANDVLTIYPPDDVRITRSSHDEATLLQASKDTIGMMEDLLKPAS